MRAIKTNRRKAPGKAFMKTALAVCIAAASAQAWSEAATDKAQSEPTEKELAALLEEVTVYGTRRSLELAMDIKRESDTQVDAISAADIGKMPDLDIGDSLQRVTGVQIERGIGGRATEVNIRGLPGHYTRVLYNGRNITTVEHNNYRNFSFDTVPSVFVSAVEVHKTSKADIKEGGVSGTVNIRSQRAFDIGERVIRLDARSSWSENNGEFSPRQSGIFSDLFADDTIGVTVGFDTMKMSNGDQSGASNSPATKFPEADKDFDYNGDGDKDDLVYSNTVTTVRSLDAVRDREAYFGNIEWRPNENFKLFAEGYTSNYETQKNRKRMQYIKGYYWSKPQWNTAPVPEDQQSFNYNGYEYVDVFHGTNVKRQTSANKWNMPAEFQMGLLDVEYTYDDWNFKFGYSNSKSSNEQYFPYFSVFAPDVDVTIDQTTGSLPGYTFADAAQAQADALNPALYTDASMSGEVGTQRTNDSEIFSFDVERELNLDFGGAFEVTSVKFGAEYSKDEITVFQKWMGLNNAQLAKLAGLPEGEEYRFPLVEADVARGDWFDGKDGLSANQQPQAWLSPDVDAFFDQYSMEELVAAAKDAGRYLARELDGLYEDSTAAYVRFDFAALDGALTANVGLRYVETDQKVIGPGMDLDDGFIEFGEDLSWKTDFDELATRERTYSEVLPSLNVKWEMNDEMLVRFGASRAMARPQRSALTLGTWVNKTRMEAGANDPDVDPFISRNLDLSYEWYFDDASMVSVALFHKQIESMVESTRTPGYFFPVVNEDTGESRMEEFTLVGRTNVEGVSLKGVEVSFQTPFTFLPGLLKNTGVTANYTYIDNSDPVRLVASSKHNGNLGLYYSTENFDTRLSYTYRGEYLAAPAFEATPARYTDAVGYLTWSASYSITDNISASLNVTNLTNESSNLSYDNGFHYATSDTGRAVSAGLGLRF